MEKSINEKGIQQTTNTIIESIKYFNWKLTQIWIENNCIYGERIRVNGDKITEGLYAASEDDPQDVYRVYNKLKYTMNLLNMLNDNNILI